jgi:hypothetical protein
MRKGTVTVTAGVTLCVSGSFAEAPFDAGMVARGV